jgi:hypothetical protein
MKPLKGSLTATSSISKFTSKSHVAGGSATGCERIASTEYYVSLAHSEGPSSAGAFNAYCCDPVLRESFNLGNPRESFFSYPRSSMERRGRRRGTDTWGIVASDQHR